MKTFIVMIGAIVLGWAACAQADVIVYNANTDMVADETGSSPSATFGQWQIEWADPLQVAAASVGGGALAGWGQADATPAPYVVVNTTGAAWGSTPGFHLAKDEMSFHGGSISGSWGGFALLDWTAPRAGIVNINTAFEDASASNAPFVDVLKNDSTHLFESYINSSHTSALANLPNIAVAAGDKIGVLVGSGGTDGDQVGVFETITYVPEPGSLAILGSALIGLLCYAWRKRK